MEEIRQLKADKAKEKESQHDPEHVIDKEKTLVDGRPQNMEQCFDTMVEIAALLEQEKAKAPKERFYPWKTPYPLRILSKLYPNRYEARTFTQYDGRKGSVIEHVKEIEG